MEKIILDSIKSYFKTLNYIGYVPRKDIYKIIKLISINDFLEMYSEKITEKEYIELNKQLELLCGSSCLIPYKEFIKKHYDVNKIDNLFILDANNNFILNDRNKLLIS